MQRFVTIILLAVLMPLFVSAATETMEARRQRLMRKYLSEQQTIEQSEMFVPDAEAEELQVQDSEKFKLPEAELNRQAHTAPPPQRMRRPVPQQNQDSNWLLGDDSSDEDPYALDSGFDSSDSFWGTSGDGSFSSRPGTYDSLYGASEDAGSSQRSSLVYDPRTRRMVDPRTLDPRSSRYTSPSGDSSLEGESDDGMFGSRESESESGTVWGLTQPRTYGQSPSTGLLETPFSSSSRSRDAESDSMFPGFTTRRSSLETQREQQGQQWERDPEPEFQRTDPYEQWKERNRSQTWDPTADDAYLNEMLRRDRR